MFKDGILGLIPEADFLNLNWTPSRPDNPVDQLVGDVSTDNILVKWQQIAQEYQLPVMAQYHAFDVETQKTIRKPIENREIEKGLIKVKLPTSELLREAIRNGIPAGNESALYDYVFNDIVSLAEQVVTRTKVAKNEMLATGKVTIHENNLDLNVDYGVPADNLAHTLDFGAGASAPLTDQLEAITEAAKAKGQKITGLYTSSSVLNKMRRDSSVQRAINGVNMQGVLVKNADLKAYLSDEFGIGQVIDNDLMYSLPYAMGDDEKPVVTPTRFYPHDKATFFAPATNGQVGSGLWGPPPETELARISDASVSPSSFNGYVYVSQWAEKDPVILWTKASTLFMPVLYNPAGLFVASVVESAAAQG